MLKIKNNVGGSSGKYIIAFAINVQGMDSYVSVYKVENGMSWYDFINSEYNTDGYFVEDNYIKGTSNITVMNLSYHNVTANDMIEDLNVYIAS